MNKRTIVLVLSCLILRGSHLKAEGLPVFSDDFSTKALLAEKWKLTSPPLWKVDGDALVTDARAGVRSAFAKFTHAGPVEVRLRVKALEIQKGKWCGVRVRGILFTLVHGGFWHVYNIEGKKRALGGIQSAERPVPGRWYDFRIVQRGRRYQWSVNGKLVADFSEPNRVKRTVPLLELATSGPPISYDNIRVFALPEKKDASPNLIRNSSFESVPDHLPTPWIPAYMPAIPPEILWRDWRVVESPAYRGSRSIRIAGRAKKSIGFLCGITGIAIGQPCTFSIYLKADRAKCNAKLVMWERLGKGHSKPVELTTDWKRYSFTIQSPAKNLLRAGLQLREEAVVWADAAQLELGDAVSPYRASMFDEKGLAAKPAPLRVPGPKTLRFVDPPLRMDGRLDEPVWNDESRVWPLVLAGEKEPVEKTEAYMLFSWGALHIGMRCHDSQIDKLKADVREHDGNVYVDDSVEVFLDTNHDRQTYFHLAVNSKGVRFDAAPGRDRSWNGQWSARTSVGKDAWTVEISLPLSSLQLSPMTSAEWGVNLCRHCPRLGEFSSTAVTPVPNFHRADLYPTLKWPKPGVLKAPQILPVDWMLLAGGGKGYRLSGRLVNRTGRARKVVLAGKLEGVSWRGETFALKKDEDRPFTIPIEADLAKKATEREIIGELLTIGDDQDPVVRTFDLRVPVRSVFSGLLERSVYAGEKEAMFIADILLPPEELAAAKVHLAFDKAPERAFEFPELARKSELSFSIEKLSPGAHPVTARLLSGKGKEIGQVRMTLSKLPPAGNAVAIDRTRRCLLVRGQPWLAIAPLFQFWGHTPLASVELSINHSADSGFRTVMVVAKTEGKGLGAVWRTVFDLCEKRGLKVIAWPGAFPKLVPEDFINRWKTHPALLAWMPIDEPELYAKPEDVTRAIAHFRKIDPYHPVYMNNTVMGIPSHFAGLPGDIVSIDDYLTNRPNRKVVEMIRDIEMMNRAAAPSRNPVWMFLSGNNLYNHSREPSAGEQVAQTYGCVIAGASGIKYFMGYPVSPKHWAAVKRTNSELLRLAPVIFSREQAPSAECSASSIHFIIRRSANDVYLIAVNVEDRPVPARFSLPGIADADAVVLFEDRVVRIGSGLLEDTFAPHERHVYRFRGD